MVIFMKDANDSVPSHCPLIICDLEATCWDEPERRAEMEIIEIGAVRMLQGRIVSSFSSFVRPINHPLLSNFCTQLTSITQSQVDHAETLPTVFARFLDWIGPESFIFCSWGQYDLHQFQLDTQRHQLSWPLALNRHLNLKHAFARWRQVKPCGMERALQLVQLPLVGTHHRGIDDARNIAQLTRLMLDWLVKSHAILQQL